MKQKTMRTYLPLLFASLVFVISTGMILIIRAEKTAITNARSPAQLFAKYCTACHGSDGKAKTKKGKLNHSRDISDPKWQDEVSDERIFNSIMNGRNVRGNMPSFSKHLSDQEAESLVTYVRGLRK